MASPGTSTYDQSPPQRPTVDSFNGCVKEDDQESAPDPRTMPNAPEANTTSLTLISHGAMANPAKVSVTYSGSPLVPGIAFSIFPNVATSVTPSIARTAGGAAAGDVTITWPAGSVVPSNVNPTVSLNGTTNGDCLSPSATLVANGVRVQTKSLSGGVGVAADLPFTVVLH